MAAALHAALHPLLSLPTRCLKALLILCEGRQLAGRTQQGSVRCPGVSAARLVMVTTALSLFSAPMFTLPLSPSAAAKSLLNKKADVKVRPILLTSPRIRISYSLCLCFLSLFLFSFSVPSVYALLFSYCPDLSPSNKLLLPQNTLSLLS